MNDGQPGKLIAKNSISEAKGLAVLLQSRADAAASGKSQTQWARMRARLSLFNIGRYVSLLAGLSIFLFLAARHQATTSLAYAFVSAVLAIFGLPLLLSAVIQGARMRLFGAAEFFCGLAYVPMGTIGGAKYRERSYYMLALIYSGTGRFTEAEKYMRRVDANHDVFSAETSSSFNERRRLPELLARMGRGDEALATARQNIALTRHQLKDVPCLPLRELLQCDLVSAAIASGLCDQSEERWKFLNEAILLEQSSQSLQIIGRYASALRHSELGDYNAAIASLQAMSAVISEARLDGDASGEPVKLNANGVPLSKHQEIWSLSQTLLGRCYLAVGKVEKLPEILLNLQTANRSEPPASEICVKTTLLRIEFLIGQSNLNEALQQATALVKLLADSDCPKDRLLLLAAQKYAEVASLCGLEESGEAVEMIAAKLRLNKPQTADGTTEPSTYVVAGTPIEIPPRLPSVADSKHVANRAMLLAVSAISYTVYFAATGHPISLMAMLSIFSLLCCAAAFADVKKHLRNRHSKLHAAQVIKDASQRTPATVPVPVVMRPQNSKQNFLALRYCTISSANMDFGERQIELVLNDNLIYVCTAFKQIELIEIAGRAYMQDNAIVALEVLGKVLTPIM